MPCLQQNNRKDVHITYRDPTDKRKLHQETCRMLCELVTNIKRKGKEHTMEGEWELLSLYMLVQTERKRKNNILTELLNL